MASKSQMDPLKNCPDFEKPILELEMKITDLEHLAESTNTDFSRELSSLRDLRDKMVHKIYNNLSAWDRVKLARHPLRPLTTDYINLIFEDFIELKGDRLFSDDPAIVTGFAHLGGRRIFLVGHRKGKTTEDRMRCNWGCAHPEGYRKALLKMKLAEKFGLPIVTVINTSGAYPGIGAEERGQAGAIAKNILEMSRLRVPIVSVVIGEGGSGGALGIGVCDRLLMLEYSYYSVISPEGCAAILWKNGEMAPQAAAALKLTATDLYDLSIVDEIVEEPLGGAHRDPMKMAFVLRDHILKHVKKLSTMSIDDLLLARYEKYRQIGNLPVA
ncbi:MAG: acetyl-CoA carboxylase carboxyltransferase subunit alpha [Planctomycetota bacterium]